MNFSSLNNVLDPLVYGGKAANLSRMLQASFPVPSGFSLSKKCFLNKDNEDFIDELSMEIRSELLKYSKGGFMVRSSAIGEDGQDHSFAGQLSSFICSNDPDEIIEAVKKCWDSYNNRNVADYAKHSGQELNGMGVIIQELIDPDYAGVMFTRSHLHANEILVEYVEGHGEKLVAGEVNPTMVHFNSDTHEFSTIPSVDFREGLKLAKELEKLYGYALDIEWVIKDGQFYFVQARPITSLYKHEPVYWSNTNVNENYPDPLSPMLYSIARQAYYNYFKNLAELFQVPQVRISELEREFQNVIGAFGGRMYYNMTSIHKILSSSPFSALLIASFDDFVGYTDGSKSKRSESTIFQKIKFLLSFWRYNRTLIGHVVQFENRVVKHFEGTASLITESDMEKSFNDFIEIRMHSWYHASLADFFAMSFHGFLGKITKQYFGPEASGIQNQLIQAIPNLISSEPVLQMHDLVIQIQAVPQLSTLFMNSEADVVWQAIQSSKHHSFFEDIQNYLRNWGFRCSGELMLTSKNYIESPEVFIALLQQMVRGNQTSPREKMKAKHMESLEVKRKVILKIVHRNWYRPVKAVFHVCLLNYVVKQTHRGISSRERVRLKQAQLYYGLKKTLHSTGEFLLKNKRVGSQNDVFFMTYSELIEEYAASQLTPNLQPELIKLRKKEWLENHDEVYPDDFYSERGKLTDRSQVVPKTEVNTQGGDLVGLCACGGKITAPVKVLDSVLEAHKLQPGDVLVTRQTDPGWVTVFPLISGLIVERGGMLSHGAVVSREFGIPAIVGVSQATLKLKDFDVVTLNAFEGTIQIHHENS